MNIEIQRYYTDNESRIAFIDSEIENMNKNISVEETYNLYEELLKAELLEYGIKRELIKVNYYFAKEWDLQKYTVETLCNKIAYDKSEYKIQDEVHESCDALRSKLKKKKDVESLLDFEKIILFYYNLIDFYQYEKYSEYKHTEWERCLIDGRIRELINELKKHRNNIVEKNVQYLPKIKTLKKEKQLLVKVNKQLKIDYKGEIVV